MSSRHLSRSIAMQSLYEWDFYGQKPDDLKNITERNIKEFGPGLESSDFIWKLIDGVVSHLPQLNQIIEKTAPEWPLEQITIIDRNVLRIGLYELLFEANKELVLDYFQHTNKNMEEANTIINGFYNLYFKGETKFRGARHYDKKEVNK